MIVVFLLALRFQIKLGFLPSRVMRGKTGQGVKWVILYKMLQNYHRLCWGSKIELPTLFVIQQSNRAMMFSATFYTK